MSVGVFKGFYLKPSNKKFYLYLKIGERECNLGCMDDYVSCFYTETGLRLTFRKSEQSRAFHEEDWIIHEIGL